MVPIGLAGSCFVHLPSGIGRPCERADWPLPVCEAFTRMTSRRSCRICRMQIDLALDTLTLNRFGIWCYFLFSPQLLFPFTVFKDPCALLIGKKRERDECSRWANHFKVSLVTSGRRRKETNTAVKMCMVSLEFNSFTLPTFSSKRPRANFSHSPCPREASQDTLGRAFLL